MNEHLRGLERIALGDIDTIPIPPAMTALIAEARLRAERFARARAAAGRRIPAFTPGDGGIAYRILTAIVGRGLARGTRFCEWGSGLGVATCAARWLGLDACGIEIEPDLVAEATRLAADHAIDARFVVGSYRPPGTETESVAAADLGHGLGFSVVDFDIVYVYPWPDEERLVGYLFRAFAPAGALLAMYRGGDHFALWRQPGAPAAT